MDAELRDQLLAYLQGLIDEPDDRRFLPPYLNGRSLTKLYVEPGLQELEMQRGESRPGSEPEPERSIWNTYGPVASTWETTIFKSGAWRALILVCVS